MRRHSPNTTWIPRRSVEPQACWASCTRECLENVILASGSCFPSQAITRVGTGSNWNLTLSVFLLYRGFTDRGRACVIIPTILLEGGYSFWTAPVPSSSIIQSLNMTQEVNESVNQHSVNQSINQSTNKESISQSVNQSMNQSINRLLNHWTNQSVNESMNQSIHKSSDQWINKDSIKQSVNQHPQDSHISTSTLTVYLRSKNARPEFYPPPSASANHRYPKEIHTSCLPYWGFI